MLRMTRKADYGLVLLTRFAAEPAGAVHSARDLAEATGIPQPTVSKVLKTLARHDLLASQRGVRGGYRLGRPANEIRLDQVLAALEGPIAMTECSPAATGACEHEPVCPARSSLQKVDRVVRDALQRMTLAEMAGPLPNPGARVIRV
ncbi:MAG TPA: SUF system Fe-S cluster assembly regulator [Planctomycetota bacterium]